MSNLVSSVEDIHPDVRRAMNVVDNPEVQEIMKRLSSFGLAVAVPHMHGDKGNFIPLPNDIVSFESGLKISFLNNNDIAVRNGIPVMWRWDTEKQAAALCASCSGACCFNYPPNPKP